MTSRRGPLLVTAIVTLVIGVTPAAAALTAALGAQATELWAAWRDRFVEPNGRVVDNANQGISHSEGQGYGMLLAYLAGDPVTFHRIWTFTRTELLVRDDGLAAWRWEPNARPHLTDINNASDGDILIAYALALAGEAWGEGQLVGAAREIAEALGERTIVESRGRRVLLPGVDGFSATERPDGPVVNLSYWVFEAFPVLAGLDPETGWQVIADDGLELLRRSGFGPAGLPPEWLGLGSARLHPAAGFDAVFGYNAIRIPLYLLRAGLATPDLVRPYLANRTPDGASAVVLLATGAPIEPLIDQGYRMVLAAVDCAVNGTPLPADLLSFEAARYYSATLYLLSWFHLAEERPECL